VNDWRDERPNRKGLGCFSIVGIAVLAAIVLTSIFDGDSSESPEPEASVSASIEPMTSPSPTAETSDSPSEAELQTARVCDLASRVDNASRRVIREVATGEAKYEDKDVIALVVRNLRQGIRDNPEVGESMASQFEELARRSMAIANHIQAVETYDNLDKYLADFTKINQNYVRYDDVADFCGF